jgi:ubiquinone/menaquinone biosynthesis C-methylase UbiE
MKETSILSFILMNIDEIKFENEYDVVYSKATLHWIKDHQRLLKKTFSKRSGLVVFLGLILRQLAIALTFSRLSARQWKERRFLVSFRTSHGPGICRQ